MDIVARIKKWLARLLVLVRKKLRETERRLDERRPPRVLGVVLVLFGALFVLAGLVMLVLPGPGLLTLALGIVGIIVGLKVFRGEYGPGREERERAQKHERMQRRRSRERS